jgi:hypothetical protein
MLEGSLSTLRFSESYIDLNVIKLPLMIWLGCCLMDALIYILANPKSSYRIYGYPK